MRRMVLVERRADERSAPWMDLVASALRRAGYIVRRWRNKRPVPAILTSCDLVVLWNGIHPLYDEISPLCKRSGVSMAFAELGWMPQDGAIQLDPEGINAKASWMHDPVTWRSGGCVDVPSGDLLVILQSDGDTQIRCLSPYFKNMAAFIRHLADHSLCQMRVRRHPRAVASKDVVQTVDGSDKMTWDRSASLDEAMESACALACVNSTCGLEALDIHLPVLCYGDAVYRREGAVWCMTADPSLTRDRTKQLDARCCDQIIDAQTAVLRHVLSHQYTAEQVPDRVMALMRNAVNRKMVL